MLGLNQMKKFIYLIVFLVSLSFSNFAQGQGAEVSGHFGMKFGSELNLTKIINAAHINDWSDQKNMPFHLGLDTVYRHMMNEAGSFGVGLRYRFAFTGEKDFDHGTNANDKYNFTHHRVALLLNYRFHMDQFFVGPVLGLDVWKYLKFSYNGGTAGTDRSFDFTSNQFLWNRLSGQAGLELGYKATDNLFVKLEAGYDLSQFSNLECKTTLGSASSAECSTTTIAPNPLRDADDADYEPLKLNGFYATLGIGWFFG